MSSSRAPRATPARSTTPPGIPSRSAGPSQALLKPTVAFTPYAPAAPRRPRANNTIAASALRPHVQAKHRLRFWVSTYAIRAYNDAAASLSPEITSHLLEVLLASLDEQTHITYAAGLLRFHQFADRVGLPEDDRMPASGITLAAFAADSAGDVSGKTIANWLAGIHAWHRINLAPWHGDETLSAVRRAVKKLTPSTSVQPKRPPATVQHMHALVRGLDLSNSRDVAIFAAAVCAFWGCCRLGELLVKSASGFNSHKHVARGSRAALAAAFTTLESGATFVKIHIPWTKTTAEDGADLIFTKRRGNPSCPVTAFQHHLKVNERVPPSAPLFAFATADGWATLTKSSFLERCTEVFSAAGLHDILGHSFRIGGATELLLMGTPPDVVRVQGRWQSDSFLEYWRKIDSILPLFLTQDHGKERVALLQRSIRPFLTARVGVSHT
jgi:hypothetical protein